MLGDFVNYVGLAGLIASFFSIIFAYSRQLFALSRAGYLPRGLSVTSARKTPHVALIVPGMIGFLLAAITEDGAKMINIAVFGATVSYVLMTLSHIVLRRREPDLERPYVTPGGTATSGVAFVLALRGRGGHVLRRRAGRRHHRGHLRHRARLLLVLQPPHLVADAPEEEFEAIERAEAELGTTR